MAEPAPSRVWFGRLVFILIVLGVLFVQILPLSSRPIIWAAPNWGLAITLAYVARRPDFAPIIVIAALFFLIDLLSMSPPGLWAGLVVILTEMLRKRAKRLRNMPFAFEWGTVAVGIVAITLLNRAVLLVVMTTQAPLGLTLIQMVTTIIFYPVVVLVAHYVFGVSRPLPGQTDSRGQHL
ncbi:rod shape-determining protein MreD [Yoonia sp. MH D7]